MPSIYKTLFPSRNIDQQIQERERNVRNSQEIRRVVCNAKGKYKYNFTFVRRLCRKSNNFFWDEKVWGEKKQPRSSSNSKTNEPLIL